MYCCIHLHLHEESYAEVHIQHPGDVSQPVHHHPGAVGASRSCYPPRQKAHLHSCDFYSFTSLCLQVLLLDELTTFLEAEDQAAVMRAVRAAVDGPERVTALWVTHRLEELHQADAATIMTDGRVQFTGSAQEAKRYMRGLGARL